MLTRDQVLAAKDLETEVVHVPEWGGDVIVRGLTGRQRDQFELELIEQRGQSRQVNLRNLRAKLIAKSCVDEAGKLLFKSDDVEALGEKSAAALQRIYEVAQRLSGLSGAAVEELTLELGEEESGGSGSDSHLLSDTVPSPKLKTA